MGEIVLFVLCTGVVPVLINKSTEGERFSWLKLYLRESWTIVFLCFVWYFLHKPDMVAQLSKWHSIFPGFRGYALAAISGAILLSAWWWFAGKMLRATAVSSDHLTAHDTNPPLLPSPSPIQGGPREKIHERKKEGQPPKPVGEGFASTWTMKYDLAHATLFDLFQTDFTDSIRLGGHKTLSTPTTAPVRLTWFCGVNSERRDKILEFYIPYAADTYNLAHYLIENKDLFLNEADHLGVATTKIPGDSNEQSTKGAVFSNRIFIYHEAFLTPEQSILLNQYCDSQGISLILRSSDYLSNQVLRKQLHRLDPTQPQ